MRWQLHFMTVVLATGSALAQGVDPLKSTECTQSLEALRALETVMVAAASHPEASEPVGRLATIEAARRRAAHECLGSRQDAASPVERLARPPVAVAPVRSPSPALQPAPAAALPPTPIPPLRTITQCDPSGCWASDGSRLNRIGQVLVGPLGVCTVQSSVLSCR